MAGNLKDYLTSKTADYTATRLSVTPQRVIRETGKIRQRIVEFDDETVGVLTRSSHPVFILSLQWNRIPQAEADTIFDFYFDPAKGQGNARTFEFLHPGENGQVYVARFWGGVAREIKYWRKVSVQLRVEGYAA